MSKSLKRSLSDDDKQNDSSVTCAKCTIKVDKTNHEHRPIYVCKKCGKDVCYNCADEFPTQWPIYEARCPVCKTWEPAFIPCQGPYVTKKDEERSQEYYEKYPL